MRVASGPIRDVRDRKNVLDIDKNSEEWKNLLKAFKTLEDRGADDVTGYAYQAEIHRRWCGGQLGQIHGSWLFLPWHRAYLYFFEQLLQLAVPDATPPVTLPYWDWTTYRKVPEVFFETDSPLYHKRGVGKDDELPEGDVDVAVNVPFERFGGTASSAGDLEANAHSNVHVWVGGDMRFIQRSARDPLFWFHHANVDRLWDYWERVVPGHSDPSDDSWRTTRFTFYDHPVLGPRDLAVGQLLSTTDLGYDYIQPLRELKEVKPFGRDRLRYEGDPLTAEQQAKLKSLKAPGRQEVRVEGVAMPEKDDIRVWVFLNREPKFKLTGDPREEEGYVGAFTLMPMEDRTHAHPQNYYFDVSKAVVRKPKGDDGTLSVTLVFRSQGAGKKPGKERLRVKTVRLVQVD